VIPVKRDFLNSNKRVCHPELVERYPDKQKTYPPGSQWLYFKIYTGIKTADKLLKNKIKPFVQLLKEEGLIEKWFFLRYQDPDFHLRLRFYHGSKPDFYKTILDMFYAHFSRELSDGLIYDLQLATYKPEYSRYPDINEAETLFMHDSEFILNRLESDEELYRLETALTQIHALLFDLSLKEKVSFCLNQRDGFLEEFGQNLKTVLNKLYRQHSAFVKSILDTKSDLSIMVPEKKALASYIHMHVNRNFIAEARKYELVLYHFLYRYYESALAKKDLQFKGK
jgi:thiopeptide-type bacteriocin biosynthesis protein